MHTHTQTHTLCGETGCPDQIENIPIIVTEVGD